MSGASPLGSYKPGASVLHRLRPGIKLLGLSGFAIAVIATRTLPSTTIALVLALSLTIIAGLRGRELWRTVRGFLIIAIPLLAFQTWQHGWQHGVAVVGSLFALILASSATTASTAVEDMVDTIAWALTPLSRFGVAADRVALAFSLVIRAIPVTLALAAETRDAAKARGLERNPRAYITPLVLRTVAHAHVTGEALHARGIGDDSHDGPHRGLGTHTQTPQI